MNEAGVVAFRAPLARRGSEGAPLAGGASVDGGPDARRGPGKSVPNHGTCGIFTAGDGPVTTIAIAAPGAGHAGRIVRAGGASGSGASGGAAPGGRRFQAFHGLPVINSRGAVVFRADLDDSRQGVFVSDGQRVIAVALTGERFVSLGAFPTQNDDGTVVFCGVERPAGVMGAGVLRGPQAPSPAFWSGQGFNPPGAAGGAAQASGGGVFIARDGHVSRALDTNGPFESFHGALIDGMGRIVFYATPRGAALGVFTGPDADASRLVSLGMELYGAAVVDFALNPVSINSAGQLAVRVRLEDQRQHVLRADPPAGVG